MTVCRRGKSFDGKMVDQREGETGMKKKVAGIKRDRGKDRMWDQSSTESESKSGNSETIGSSTSHSEM